MDLRFGLQSKHGLKTTALTTMKLMIKFKKIQNFNLGGRNSKRRVMVTRKMSHGGLKCRQLKS